MSWLGPVGALVALVCGWVLLVSFIRFGRAALAARPLVLWAAPFVMAFAALVGAWAMWTNSELAQRIRPDVGIYAFGVGGVIPLMHLAAERWMRANKSLERTREG